MEAVRFKEEGRSSEEYLKEIERAIAVAASLWPKQFLLRRDNIAESLYTATRKAKSVVLPMTKSTPINEIRAKIVAVSANEQQMSSSTGSNTASSHYSTLKEEEMEKKLELTKRKLQQSYKELEDAKKKRRICLVDLKPKSKHKHGAKSISISTRKLIKKRSDG